MISPVTKEISGFSVHFRPLPATKAFTLAKRVGTVLLPLIKGIDLSDLKRDIDVETLLDSLFNTISSLPDQEAVEILVDSLQGCTITAPGMPPREVNTQSDIDGLFQGELEALYEVVFESWKYNKLAPFKLAARFGFQTNKTSTSSEAANTETKHGPKLAM